MPSFLPVGAASSVVLWTATRALAAGHVRRTAGVLAGLRAQLGGISQPAVSQHLRVLRESGFAPVRPDGARHLYSLDTAGIDAVEQ